MNPPSGWTRFRLLMGLRTRLWARSAGQSPGRMVAFVLGLVIFLAWGFGLGSLVYSIIDGDPSLARPTVHAACLAIFLMQVVLGMVSLAVAEFFDVSRLLHLPIGYREVFAAMATSGVLAPIALMYASPLIGSTFALGTDWPVAPVRVALIVLQVALGHAVALTVNLAFLSILTRRRLRDLATILASLIGMGFYLTWQLAARGGASPELVASYPVDALAWVPTAWLADLFLLQQDGLTLAAKAAGLGVFVAAVLWAGSRLLRKSFLGHMPSPQIAKEKPDERGWSILPGEIAAMVRATRRTWMREPQVKAIWIQQTAFLMAPIILIQLRSPTEAGDLAGLMAVMVPFVLPMSHLHFASNLFGLDGRGLVLTLLSPIRRWRVLFARGIAVGGFFLVSDFVIVVLILVASGLVTALRQDAVTAAAVLRHLPMAPWLFVAVALTDIVLFAIGTVSSVYLPSRLATPGRRALQGQRVENVGCAAQMVRFIIFIPALAIGGALGLLALAPVAHVFFPDAALGIPPLWVLATIPAAFVIAIGLYAGALVGASRALLEREERIVRALVDHGD